MRYAFLLIPLATLLVVACNSSGVETQPTPTAEPSPVVALPTPDPKPGLPGYLAGPADHLDSLLLHHLGLHHLGRDAG